MRKLFYLSFLAAFTQMALIADCGNSIDSGSKTECEPECNPCCPRGPQGEKGNKGRRGFRGRTGATGALVQINGVAEVTSSEHGTAYSPLEYIRFDSQPISRGGLVLEASEIGSFDTIVLPKEKVDTYYLVTYGFKVNSVEVMSFANLTLEVNGLPLTYTNQDFNSNSRADVLINKTNVIVNPANTKGTLRLLNLISTATGDGGIIAYMSVVKLNGNRP